MTPHTHIPRTPPTACPSLPRPLTCSGWCRSLSALMTGTLACAHSVSMLLWPYTRASSTSLKRESTRAVSASVSLAPSWMSSEPGGRKGVVGA